MTGPRFASTVEGYRAMFPGLIETIDFKRQQADAFTRWLDERTDEALGALTAVSERWEAWEAGRR